MTFTKIPRENSSLRTEVVYAFEQTTAQTVELLIKDSMGQVLGAKRFVETQNGQIDAAPYLRRSIRFSPCGGATGFLVDTPRTITAQVQIGNTSSPLRTFTTAAEELSTPTLLSTMPRHRFLSIGESDELTFFTTVPCVVSLTASYGTTIEAQRYTAAQAGIVLFRLTAADFPLAETITLEAEGLGRVEYLIVPATQSACRLAWRSSAGAVEHYSFPVEREVTVAVKKEACYGSAGYHTVLAEPERVRTLLSAYEPTQTMEALVEILSAPQLWEVVAGVYRPVDVLPQSTTTRRFGSPCNLSLSIRPTLKTLLR